MAHRILHLVLVFIISLITQITVLEAQSLVIRDAKVLSMESDEIQDNQTIIVENGIIQWVGNADDAEIADDATVITESYYVIPGLSEMHAHIPQPGQDEQAMKDALTLYLSQGVTTIRGMLGHPAHLELRNQAVAGEIVSPRIFTSGPSFSGGSVDSPEQARQMVRDQANAGYDLLKFHPGLTVPEFSAITEEANRLGIEFSGHISHDVGLERSLNAGQGTIDHLDRYMEFLAGNPSDREDPSIIFFGYDLTNEAKEARIEEAARMTKEAGVWNVPTHTLLHNVFNPDLTVDMMRDWPGMDYISESTLNNWSEFVRNLRAGSEYDANKARRFLEIRDQLLLALHEADAGLMLGADAPQIFNPPGFSAHRELQLYVEAGLTPFEALKTGTVNVAEYLDETGTAGIVAPGARADLVLLSSNPLESIPFNDWIEGVISNGEYYDREELDQLLEDIISRTK